MLIKLRTPDLAQSKACGFLFFKLQSSVIRLQSWTAYVWKANTSTTHY